ncbi:IS605 OrfB family transposase [Saccharothrix ecbatanensis]|uniref:IS605 OrfB family transposase n=1 Tax=Saccharothrix ecbatanensis TaxID=1105145 RepID=A0A7W9LZB6_9PSEU|nr:transposase [Saccharothrix ecbatanensis]MBB5801538.1 IS605 OrfB family transposase [Saccharothrix ecbatanensis]
MTEPKKKPLRTIDAPFVALGLSGVSIRDRLKGLTAEDENVLRLVGEHLGSLASRDLKVRCAAGLDHCTDTWAGRKRDLTAESSSRWAGSITKATHDQWALARRGQAAHLASLDAGIRTVRHRLSLPLGEKGDRKGSGGYRSRHEWFVKSRRLAALEQRHAAVLADREAGRVRVVRGGRKHLNTRHNLAAANLTEADWRQRWEASRWYLDAAWTRPVVQTIPLDTARANGMVGVDTNADHFAAYRLDSHGNPVGKPHRFFYDLSGTARHRDAQVRHAITRLLHRTTRCGVAAIGLENLDFTDEKTREKHGRKRKFRQLVSGIPTGNLKARLVSMAAEHGLAVVAVDPAYTSMWGAQHWQKPLATPRRTITRHDAASIAIGRRALGHPIRRRTAPPPHHRSDDAGHRTAQAGPGDRGREETRRPVTDRAHDARSRTGTTSRTRATSASTTVRDARSAGQWVQHSLLTTD